MSIFYGNIGEATARFVDGVFAGFVAEPCRHESDRTVLDIDPTEHETYFIRERCDLCSALVEREITTAAFLRETDDANPDYDDAPASGLTLLAVPRDGSLSAPSRIMALPEYAIDMEARQQ